MVVILRAAPAPSCKVAAGCGEHVCWSYCTARARGRAARRLVRVFARGACAGPQRGSGLPSYAAAARAGRDVPRAAAGCRTVCELCGLVQAAHGRGAG